MKKKQFFQNMVSLSLIFTMLFSSYSTIQFPKETHATTNTKTKTVYFDENINRNQSQTINIPYLEEIVDIEVNTGDVNYSVNGYDVTIQTSNGDAVGTETYYNPYKYSKTATSYRTSSSTSFSNTYSYSDGDGYSGTLTKDGSSYWISGSYTPSDSKTVTTGSGSYTYGHWCGPDGIGYTGPPSLSSSQSYSSGGYYGTLYLVTRNVPHPNSPGNCRGTIIHRYKVEYYYSGTVTKPAVDTRRYRQDYSGTVYKGGNSTRNLYAYEVTITYTTDMTPPNGTITANVTDYTNQNVTLTANGTDVGVAGMERIKKPDGTYTNGAAATYTVTKNGTYTFEFEDKAGNVSTESIEITNIDKENPNGTLTPNTTDPTNEDIIITAVGTDVGVSGFKQITNPNGEITEGDTATFTVSENGTYTFTFTDHAGNNHQKNITISNIDKLAPTGTLSPNTTEVTSGNVIITAKGSDTGTSGFYRIHKPDGTYAISDMITYAVEEDGTYAFIFEDHAGNTTIEEITITNIDKESPIGKLSLSNDKPTNQSVTIFAEGTDEEAGMKSVKLPDDSIINGSEAQYEVHENGNYTFEFEDNVGNVSTETISVVNIDLIPPQGTLTPNTTSPTNQDITITAVGFDEESGIKEIKLPNGDIVQNDTATYVVSEDGTYTFEFTDVAGNTSTESITISNIDKVKPTLDYSVENTEPTNQDVMITITAEDEKSGIQSIELPDGSIVSNHEATFAAAYNGVYEFFAMDNAGNVQSISVTITNIDKTVPNATVTLSPSTYTKGEVEITLKATDENGIKSITTPNGAKIIVDITPNLTSTYSVTENGTYTFAVEDGVGNILYQEVEITNIDKEKPTLQLTANTTENTNQDVTITVTALDDVGIASIILPDDTVIESDTATFVVSENGTYQFKTIDVAGNEETGEITISNIDKVKPTIQIQNTNSNPTNQNITLNITTNDDASGVDYILTPDGEKVYQHEMTYEVSENGFYEFKVVDKAGNEQTDSITISNIDKIGPSLIVIPNTTAPTNQNITLEVEATDGELGLNYVEKPNGEKEKNTFPFEYTIEENGDYTFKAVDNAGNELIKTISITNIDKIAPQLNITLHTTDIINEDIIATIVGIDEESGVSSITLPTEEMVSSDETTFIIEENGEYTFSVMDKAGNKTTKTITIDQIDKTAPQLTLDPHTTDWVNDKVDIEVNAADNEYGIQFIIDPNGEQIETDSLTFSVQANGEYEFSVVDIAGNITTETITITNVDKGFPSILTEKREESLTNENVDIHFTVSDDASGIKHIQLPNGETIPHMEGTFTATQNGKYTFTVEDIAGNVTKETVTIDNIDKEGPDIHVEGDYETFTNQDIILKVKVSDNLAGVKNVTTSQGTIDSEPFEFDMVISENGNYVVEATDQLGNVSQLSFDVQSIDKIKPNITVKTETTKPTNSDVAILVHATDEGLGIQKVVNPDGAAQTSNFAYSYKVKNNGTYTFKVIDAAGNETTETIVINHIDKVNPTIKISKDSNASSHDKQVYKILASDKESGIKHILLPNGKTVNTYQTDFTIHEKGTYTITAVDHAGNKTTKTIQVGDFPKKKTESNPVEKGTEPKPTTPAKPENTTTPVEETKPIEQNEVSESEPIENKKPNPSFKEELVKEYEENALLVLGDEEVDEAEIEKVVNDVIDITNKLHQVKQEKTLDSLKELYDKIYEKQNKKYHILLEKENELIKEVITKETKISSNFLSLHKPYVGESLNALTLARESFPTIIEENESLEGELELQKLIQEINEDYELSVYIQRIGQTEVASSNDTKVLGTNTSGPDFTWVKVYGSVIDFANKEKVLQTVSGVTVGLTGNYKLLAQVVDKEENVVFEFTKNFLVDKNVVHAAELNPMNLDSDVFASEGNTDRFLTNILYGFIFLVLLMLIPIVYYLTKPNRRQG